MRISRLIFASVAAAALTLTAAPAMGAQGGNSGKAEVSGGAPHSQTVHLAKGGWTLSMHDSYGDGWNGNNWTLTDSNGVQIVEHTLATGSEGEAPVEVPKKGDYEIVVDDGRYQNEVSWELRSGKAVKAEKRCPTGWSAATFGIGTYPNEDLEAIDKNGNYIWCVNAEYVDGAFLSGLPESVKANGHSQYRFEDRAWVFKDDRLPEATE